MRARYAKKLHNRDSVMVRIYDGEWDIGYVMGDVLITTEGVFANVQTSKHGFLCGVHHTSLK
jgi:hypothetical protein